MSPDYYEKIPYYTINKILWRWKFYEAENGCYPMPGLTLAMDKAPPALPSPPSPTPPKAPAPKKDGFDKMLAAAEAVSRFKKWLDTPDPPKPPKPAAQQKEQDAVPPFDIQEIPRAMRKEFMTNSAKLMERWFNGELNYGPTEDDVKAEINQKGEHCPPNMYDMTTIKLDWVLKYPRAQEAYDYLVNTAIRSPNAKESLLKILSRYRAHVNINT